MTIAVGALYKGGAVVGADRMLEIGGTGRKNADCTFRKLFHLAHKNQAVAVAGDLQLAFGTAQIDEQIVCDFARLVAGSFHLNVAPGPKLARDCLEAYDELGCLLQYDHFDAEILVVEPIAGGYGLWSRSHSVRQSQRRQPREVDFGQHILGLGCYRTYITFVAEPQRIVPEARGRLKLLNAPPKIPCAMFPDGDTAESWVREVISWCCKAFPDICGGSPDVVLLSGAQEH